MSKAKTLSLELVRVIAAAPARVYDAWLDPKLPCNPWNHGKKTLMDKKVDGLFYILMPNNGGVPHFGRFLALKKGSKVKYTWMSPFTRGMESMVTVDFKKKGDGTLMTLRHSGLPNDAYGRAHNDGWGYFVDQMVKRFKGKKP